MSPEQFQRQFDVSRETMSRLQIYYSLLVKWQKAINLVSAKTLDDAWVRHFADSAQLVQFVPQNAKLADLGSGAGFPGMVLALMRPDLEAHLIESDLRKAEFLKNVSRETKSPVTVHNERVEKMLNKLKPDIITARAFAPLTDLLDMIPQECRKSRLLLLKGRMAGEEARAAMEKHGFEYKLSPSLTDPEGHVLEVTFR